MILLIIDTQKGICDNRLYAFDDFVTNVKQLLETARTYHREVIYILHDDKVGQSLTKGNEAFKNKKTLNHRQEKRSTIRR